MKKKIVAFRGCGTALVTPFTESGPDLPALEGLIDWQIESGIDALIACGTTGEPSTMSEEERDGVIACAVKRAGGRVPVIAGVGGNDTRAVTAAAVRAEALGADAVLAVTPYYNKTTQAGLVAHFTALADASNLPVILYNVPARTGLNMTPETLSVLADHPRIAAVKEASGDIKQITEIFRLCGERLAVYSGNDDHIVPFLSLGGEGVISVVSNICPRETRELVASYGAGDADRARALQFKLNPLTDALFCEVSPIPVKTALNLMGMRAGSLRLPLVPMSADNERRLKTEMRKAGLIE